MHSRLLTELKSISRDLTDAALYLKRWSRDHAVPALAGLILHLIRPRWISVAAGAAIGVLRARTTAGAAVVGFATQPPPVVEPQPRGPSQDLTLLGA